VEIPSFRLIGERGGPDMNRVEPYITYTGTIDPCGPHLTLQAPNHAVQVDYSENEYEVDSEDEAFLASLIERQFFNEDNSVFTLSDTVFEGMMDYLEKQSFDEVRQLILYLIRLSENSCKLYSRQMRRLSILPISLVVLVIREMIQYRIQLCYVTDVM
jgi:hypothetical protein